MTSENQEIRKKRPPRKVLFENVYLNNKRKDFLGTIQDYSLGGVFIRSKKAVNVGDEISLLIARPEYGGKITIEPAAVVRKETSGFALRFLDVPDEPDVSK